MAQYPIQKQLAALPCYNGSKRRLLPWIGGKLAQVLPTSQWPQHTFIDLFMGGGSVSLYAKAQGFQKVIANDISFRSQILADAFLKNQRVTLSREEVLLLTQPLPPGIPGFIETHYTPSVFSTRHAKALDGGFYWARQHPDPTKRALLLTLLWHLANEFVSFPTSLGSSNRPFAEALDGLRAWEELNPKRFTDGSLANLLKPTWSALEAKRRVINGGVFGGSPVEVFQADALTLLPQLQGDILYLDPPYAGTVSYERSHQVLDTLLTGELPPEKASVSTFSKSTEILGTLLTSAQHIPIWLLSYGNKELSLKELVALVQTQANGRVVEGFSKHYKHLAHVSKTLTNEELLVIAYPKTL